MVNDQSFRDCFRDIFILNIKFKQNYKKLSNDWNMKEKKKLFIKSLWKPAWVFTQVCKYLLQFEISKINYTEN